MNKGLSRSLAMSDKIDRPTVPYTTIDINPHCDKFPSNTANRMRDWAVLSMSYMRRGLSS
ncbi:hypothetical protein BJV78DRAFT_1161374 [Lactifluus subvellereus]|nr:hypothetical protein BJV78DRAFT_1161374 [Lactifluus subvellereus]